MRNITPQDPFRVGPDPLPHFAPFFLDGDVRQSWDRMNARRAEFGDLFAPPDTGFHHNPMESDVSYLYVAASPNFPGEVKIGMSKNRPDTRIKDAGSDPAFRKDPDIRISAYVMMKNVRAVQVERAAHKILKGWRSDVCLMGETEWFSAGPAEAMSAIELAARHYADPKRIKRFSGLIDSREHPDSISILDDLVPGFLRPGTVYREIPDAALFKGLPFSSYERPIGPDGEVERSQVIFVPISPAPDRYLWDYAYGLIPLRAEQRGEDIANLFPNTPPDYLLSLDVSVPEHQPFLRNGFVPGRVSWNGDIDLHFSLRGNNTSHIDRAAHRLYETDLVRSPLMGRITELYWELRAHLDAALPKLDDPRDRLAESDRTKYLHLLSAFLVASRPEDLTPRYAQDLHSSAMDRVGTSWDMAICPVGLCEAARPILERSGRTVERLEPSAGPDVS